MQTRHNTSTPCQIDIHGNVYARGDRVCAGTWQRRMRQNMARPVGSEARAHTRSAGADDRQIRAQALLPGAGQSAQVAEIASIAIAVHCRHPADTSHA